MNSLETLCIVHVDLQNLFRHLSLTAGIAHVQKSLQNQCYESLQAHKNLPRTRECGLCYVNHHWHGQRSEVSCQRGEEIKNESMAEVGNVLCCLLTLLPHILFSSNDSVILFVLIMQSVNTSQSECCLTW